jgi:hypothetical protein
MSRYREPRLGELTIKTIVVHTLTYFVMGILASTIFQYADLYRTGVLAGYMRPLTDPLVMAGPIFQPIRGLIFALAFYPLREILFARKYGWLVLFLELVALGILSTFAPAPASIEGIIYTRLPFPTLRDYAEIVLQAFLLSWLLFHWVNHPDKKWLSWVLGVAFAVVILFPALGLYFTNFRGR